MAWFPQLSHQTYLLINVLMGDKMSPDLLIFKCFSDYLGAGAFIVTMYSYIADVSSGIPEHVNHILRIAASN